ncbi:MAG: hypothetical protein NTY66_01995 [Candidatus Vogelbacteria bacterium]|nr:hypothetical protein [Candidatus Vogelbacteria bacterium]
MKSKLRSILFSLVLAAIFTGGQVLAGAATGVQKPVSINNPIKANTFPALLQLILNIIIEVGLPIVIIGILLVGFKYITAQGKPAEITKAHEGFKWVMVGAAIIIGSRVIVALLQNTVTSITTP